VKNTLFTCRSTTTLHINSNIPKGHSLFHSFPLYVQLPLDVSCYKCDHETDLPLFSMKNVQSCASTCEIWIFKPKYFFQMYTLNLQFHFFSTELINTVTITW
jgi:hypothetical protein